MNPYSELGVSPDADDATIKRAYKRRAHETHPDKREGGDEEFKRVNAAYQVLASPERRRQFDQTGNAEGFVDEDAMIRNQVAQLILNLIEQLPDGSDIIEAAHRHIKDQIAKGKAERSQLQKTIAKRERVLKRLKRRKAGGTDFIRAAIEAEIAKVRHAANVVIPEGLAKAEAALAMVGEYDCPPDMERAERGDSAFRFFTT